MSRHCNWPKLKPPKTIYVLFDWCYICSIELKYSGVFSNCHFSTHDIYNYLLHPISRPHNLLLSFSLSISSTYSPLCFYQPPFYIKGNWFGWSASLNKCIWTNVVPHLGFAHNILHPLDGITNPKYKLLCFLIAIIFYKDSLALAFNQDRCCHLAFVDGWFSSIKSGVYKSQS